MTWDFSPSIRLTVRFWHCIETVVLIVKLYLPAPLYPRTPRHYRNQFYYYYYHLVAIVLRFLLRPNADTKLCGITLNGRTRYEGPIFPVTFGMSAHWGWVFLLDRPPHPKWARAQLAQVLGTSTCVYTVWPTAAKFGTVTHIGRGMFYGRPWPAT